MESWRRVDEVLDIQDLVVGEAGHWGCVSDTASEAGSHHKGIAKGKKI